MVPHGTAEPAPTDAKTLLVVQASASIAELDGGPSTAILELNEALLRRGLATRIITTDASGANKLSDEELRRHLRRTSSSVQIHAMNRPRRLKPSLGAAISYRHLIPRADVVHIHGLFLFHTFVAAYLARRSGVPYVLQPHGSLEPYQRSKSRIAKGLYNCVLGNWTIKHAAGFVCASPDEAENAADIIAGKRVWIVPLGAKLDVWNADLPPTFWASDLSDRKVIVFLGRLTAKKRVDLLLAAWPIVMAAVPNVTLLLAGPIDPDLEAGLRQQALEVGDGADIRFLGPVIGGAKTFLLRHSCIFVLPSENENFAISVAEALMAGLPVVLTRYVATHRQVERFQAGIVIDDLTSEALGKAILAALEPEANRSYRKGALSAAKELSWETTAALTEAVYQEIARA